MSGGDNRSPLLHPEARLRTTPGVIAVIVSMAVAGAMAWTWAMADIRDHDKANAGQDKRIDTLEAVQRQQTDILWEIRGDVKALRAERRTP